MNYFFTSITTNYLAKARVLGKSLKKYNRDAKFILVISDEIPSNILEDNDPFDDIIYSKELSRIGNVDSFYFKHTITELCTAVKPMAALEIIERYNASSVVYLDPDIAVFNSLEELENMFEEHSIIITPHQTIPEHEDIYIRQNEILFLKRGTYNFGFFGVKSDDEGIEFLEWWNNRLMNYCFDDNIDLLSELERDGLLGMFTDQKWGDLIPSFFDNYLVLKEPGYNVCTWNLTKRHLIINEEDQISVDGKPLYFFHFSGFDSGGHHNELNKLLSYDSKNIDVKKLSKWYENELNCNGQKIVEKINFFKNNYVNGEKITNTERKIFHIRKDIYRIFENPFQNEQEVCFYNWVRKEYPQYFGKANKVIEPNDNFSLIKKIFPANTKRGQLVRKLYFYIKKR